MSEASTGVFILKVTTCFDGEVTTDYWVCGPTGDSTYAGNAGLAGAVARHFGQVVLGELDAASALAQREQGRPSVDAVVSVSPEETEGVLNAEIRIPLQPVIDIALDIYLNPISELSLRSGDNPTVKP